MRREMPRRVRSTHQGRRDAARVILPTLTLLAGAATACGAFWAGVVLAAIAAWFAFGMWCWADLLEDRDAAGPKEK